ncbi:hypothetical protein TcYC6_0014930 [Trypanosoma cruzi]|nr:hypothetical protein TcYC6_0014930 [Trypanosoma cruzi]
MRSGEIPMRLRTRRSSLRTASPGSRMVVAAFPGIDEGVVSEHTAPRTSSIYRRRVRRSCRVGARNPTILRSGAGLEARWTEVSFDDTRGTSDDVQLSPCRTSRLWRRVGADTVRLPHRRGAKHTVDAPNEKGSHGVMGRTSSCAQPRPMAEWCGLLWFLCEEFCCFLSFGTGRRCIGVF